MQVSPGVSRSSPPGHLEWLWDVLVRARARMYKTHSLGVGSLGSVTEVLPGQSRACSWRARRRAHVPCLQLGTPRREREKWRNRDPGGLDEGLRRQGTGLTPARVTNRELVTNPVQAGLGSMFIFHFYNNKYYFNWKSNALAVEILENS